MALGLSPKAPVAEIGALVREGVLEERSFGRRLRLASGQAPRPEGRSRRSYGRKLVTV
jgi:hypothetical protein